MYSTNTLWTREGARAGLLDLICDYVKVNVCQPCNGVDGRSTAQCNKMNQSLLYNSQCHYHSAIIFDKCCHSKNAVN